MFKDWYKNQMDLAIQETGKFNYYHDNFVLENMCEYTWNHQQEKITKLEQENKELRECVELVLNHPEIKDIIWVHETLRQTLEKIGSDK